MANLYVTRISPQAILPTRATPFSAGLDVSCCFHEPTVTIFDDGKSDERMKVIEILDNYIIGKSYTSINSLLHAYQEGVNDFPEEVLKCLDALSKPSIERKVIDNSLTLQPSERAMIPTGLQMSCDANHYLAFYPRSGNALKRGLTLINCVGIGDRDYKGEYYITLVNNSLQPQTIVNGDKVAQMIVRYYADVDICERPNGLPEVSSNRAGGFGSTGQ